MSMPRTGLGHIIATKTGAKSAGRTKMSRSLSNGEVARRDFWIRNCDGMQNNQMRQPESRFAIRDASRTFARVARPRDGELTPA
ncbi:hypothetical protein [Bradyrhizobium sp. BWA-3-5]|uniref:hypothetical protein n=1 Tax=Bradyrhizobium sp. BWA-3-5 TaxID=3080013 RepID=UPI00293F78EA|nr:hypothetical protein [Bradyrhizobium sp. BWA-3-5]WOH69513.1 hypothetical protein RX331_18200 [Bradyrhizobium sp. BWA-3-5]